MGAVEWREEGGGNGEEEEEEEEKWARGWGSPLELSSTLKQYRADHRRAERDG